MLSAIKRELKALSHPDKIGDYQRFFKTGKGEYGEGDVFIGLTVPEQRSVAKKYLDADRVTIRSLLESKIHEHRLTGLLILVQQFQNAVEAERKRIVAFYLKHKNRVNNWDLVDLSAHKILGEFLVGKDRQILYKLAKSKVLWDRRIAVVACFAFINRGDFQDILKLAKLLLEDYHDLMHKAVGWALREIGKKELKSLLKFLDKHHKVMPRTMLRYSIERLSEKKRKHYMKK